MSAIAALAGFNGKGTQGLVATETPTGDDRSAFWNENDTTKTLLYGSTFTKCAESEDTPNMGYKTWIIDSGIDLLGDIGLEMKVYGGSTTRKFTGLFNIIDRIDFKVGSNIWQRLDFKSLLDIITSKEESYSITSTSFSPSTPILYPSASFNDRYAVYVFPLHLLTEGLNMRTPLPSSMVTETGHFVCASPDQQVSVSIYFKDWEKIRENYGTSTGLVISNIKTSLYYKHYILSNFERQKIINNPIPKRLNSTQSRMFNDLTNSPNSTIVLDVSEFSLYSSNLLLSLNNQTDETATLSSYSTYIAFDFELLLNNTSVFGVISSSALNMFGQHFSKRTNIDSYSTADVFGVYVIPLASCYNSASYVPLNRFDSIQIKLYITNKHYSVNPSNTFGARVTCEGQVTALYDKGLASIRNS